MSGCFPQTTHSKKLFSNSKLPSVDLPLWTNLKKVAWDILLTFGFLNTSYLQWSCLMRNRLYSPSGWPRRCQVSCRSCRHSWSSTIRHIDIDRLHSIMTQLVQSGQWCSAKSIWRTCKAVVPRSISRVRDEEDESKFVKNSVKHREELEPWLKSTTTKSSSTSSW